MPLTSTVRRFFRDMRLPGTDTALLTGNESLVVAVSGGPDSLALLHVLSENELLPREYIVVSHLDHGLRPSSVDEARFVAQTAAGWGVRCYADTMDVNRLAVETGLSLEDAGRQARYRFFARVATEVGGKVIATGHNADDQAETVLMHFLRGTGLAGLRGMLPVGPLPGAPHLTLIRPLLSVSREEVETYCQSHRLNVVVDETNRDTDFFRNRLRHELLPLLETFNPQVKELLGQTAAILAADYDLLSSLIARAWESSLDDHTEGRLRFTLETWQRLPISIQRSVLRKAVEQLLPDQGNVGFRVIDQALAVVGRGKVGAEVYLPGNIILKIGYSTFELATDQKSPDVRAFPQLVDDAPLVLSIPGESQLSGGWRLVSVIPQSLDLETVWENQDPWQAFVDVGDVASLVIRPRLPGERLMPLGMSQMIKLKEVMINRKIPAAARGRWPIVAIDSQVVWIVGHAIDARYRVRPDSSRIVRLRVEQATVS